MKILSIDGGGIRGLIPALILAEIEERTQKPISELFDLVAGTSTGGLIALGLNTRKNNTSKPQYSAQEIAQLYISEGKEIFPDLLHKKIFSLGGLIDECYPHKPLEKILDKYFQEALMNSCLTRTMVTTYDIQNRTTFFIKSWDTQCQNITMKKAVRATTAAPTYFEPTTIKVAGCSKTLIDGGVFINSPVVSAYVVAQQLMHEQDEKQEKFMVLSLGTGEFSQGISLNQAKDWGKAGWIVPLLDCMFDGVADAADYQMKTLLPNDYFRFQVMLDNEDEEKLDNVQEANIEKLIAKAEILIKNKDKEIDEVCDCLS